MRPNLKEFVDLLNILPLCWSPVWLPCRLIVGNNPILPSSFNQSVAQGRHFSLEGKKKEAMFNINS